MADTNARVAELISEHLGHDNVKPDDDLKADLNADSLDFVELTMAFEDEFGIEIEDNELGPLVLVSDWQAIVARKVAAK